MRRRLVRREAREEFHRGLVVREFLLFFAELRGMGLAPAMRESHRMLQVQHLVVEHVGDHVFGNVCAVELAIDHDLIERRIEAAKLRSPDALAPSEARERQRILKIVSD